MSNRFIKLCFAASLLTFVGLGQAMSIDGAGTIVVVPLFADTPNFASEVTIYNPNGALLEIAPNFVGMDGRATVGRIDCPVINVPANTSVQYSLPSLCPVNPGSNNGKLTLVSNSAPNLPFFAYARIQTLAGQGFSVEGFPIGSFEGGLAVATGLKRIAAAPTFQSNCVVGSMHEAVNYTLQLQNSAGTVIGNTLTGSLTTNQMTAFIDIFAAVNAPPGDYTNVRALFVNSNAGSSASLLGYCTVQDNTSLGADFRMAKVFNPKDESKRRSETVDANRNSATLSGTPFRITDVNKRNTHVIYLRHPDYLSCALATGAANLEMRLLDPQNTVMASGATFDGFTKFPIGTPSLLKSAVNGGVNGRWLIEVQTETTSIPVPVSYSIQCQSGNGHTMLDLIDTTQPRYIP